MRASPRPPPPACLSGRPVRPFPDLTLPPPFLHLMWKPESHPPFCHPSRQFCCVPVNKGEVQRAELRPPAWPPPEAPGAPTSRTRVLLGRAFDSLCSPFPAGEVPPGPFLFILLTSLLPGEAVLVQRCPPPANPPGMFPS